MAIAIHGDNTVDEHFKDLTEQTDRVLNDLNNLTEQVSDIQNGKVLDKKWNKYLINQSKVNLEKALPVFEKLVEGIKDKIRIRNEQSSTFRAKREAEKAKSTETDENGSVTE